MARRAGLLGSNMNSRTKNTSTRDVGRDSVGMKPSRNHMNRQNKQGVTSKPRPEIRDDLDSRSQNERGSRVNKSKKGEAASESTVASRT